MYTQMLKCRGYLCVFLVDSLVNNFTTFTFVQGVEREREQRSSRCTETNDADYQRLIDNFNWHADILEKLVAIWGLTKAETSLEKKTYN